MGQWYCKSLGSLQNAVSATVELQDAFLPFFVSIGQSKHAAIFFSSDKEDGVGFAYFTPEAAALGSQLGASPCEKPSCEGISLLVGDQSAIQHFFPKKRDR